MAGHSDDSVVPSTAYEPWPDAAARLHESVMEQRRWAGSLDDFRPLYDRLPVINRTVMMHLHGLHDGAEHPYAHCPLCLAFGPPPASVTGSSGVVE